MSRIFEALELTGVDFEEKASTTVLHTKVFSPASKPFAEKILALSRRIDAAFDNRAGKVISIAALESGSHGFTYAFELARLSSTYMKRRVLLLGTWQSGSSTKVLQNGVARGWESAMFGNESVAEFVHQLNEPPIAVSQLNLSKDALAALAASPRFGNMLRRMRKRYDLIVVDTPPVADAMDAVLLAQVVDGTVLIVNAGESRWQVVRNTADQLAAQQGNLLGVVLNKRRHYIPEFIYRKL